eukprot:TRINITY_DN5460_c0_g1_i3.p2 TRINITY_DN5460_c0_g1~~TRINITY_DN5460_c0_g1_i3.p2  ORF type:complete len:122 (-),score=26.47 TRINITY_DN5460_c0_g1_i3:148-513(-)
MLQQQAIARTTYCLWYAESQSRVKKSVDADKSSIEFRQESGIAMEILLYDERACVAQFDIINLETLETHLATAVVGEANSIRDVFSGGSCRQPWILFFCGGYLRGSFQAVFIPNYSAKDEL